MTKHEHHDLIVEWVKDTSREVEYYSEVLGEWVTQSHPCWLPASKYRFKPKKEVVSSLSGKDLESIWFSDHVKSNLERVRVIANDAAAQEREDIIEWIKSNCSGFSQIDRLVGQLENKE